MDHGSHNMSGISRDGHEAAAGRPGTPAKVSRTIKVTMDDTMRFTPNELNFKAGETVCFEVRNNGKIRHEMVIDSVGFVLIASLVIIGRTGCLGAYWRSINRKQEGLDHE